jgi:hypothetical protein
LDSYSFIFLKLFSKTMILLDYLRNNGKNEA